MSAFAAISGRSVTRALALDLIALGEERAIDGAAHFGVAAGGAFFPIAPGRSGARLMRLRRSTAGFPDARALSGCGASRRIWTDALANPRGDHTLDDVPLSIRSSPKPAAVLVPVVMRDEPTLLFTERSAHLRQHSGQIAFPGGRVDPDRRLDRSPPPAARPRRRSGSTAAHQRRSAISTPICRPPNYLVMPVVGA